MDEQKERAAFEAWYADYNPAGKSDKQRAQDAYRAAMAAAPAPAPLTDDQANELAKRHFERLNGRPHPWEGVQPWVLAAMRDAHRIGTDAAPAQHPDTADAERYRWLRNESWGGQAQRMRYPCVIVFDGAGNRKTMLAEEAMDAAIDAARAQAQKGSV